jgi:hypothetical protein
MREQGHEDQVHISCANQQQSHKGCLAMKIAKVTPVQASQRIWKGA